jgi:hypothetical protein
MLNYLPSSRRIRGRHGLSDNEGNNHTDEDADKDDKEDNNEDNDNEVDKLFYNYPTAKSHCQTQGLKQMRRSLGLRRRR